MIVAREILIKDTEKAKRAIYKNTIRPESGDGCWEWTGYKSTHGYGKVRVGGPQVLAHRVSYTIFVGPISPFQQALHKCDNPGCVNPDHIFLGTSKDNMADMARKKRYRPCHGEKNYRAMFTDAQVVEIRELWDSGAKYKDIARRFGCKKEPIKRICRNDGWTHLPPAKRKFQFTKAIPESEMPKVIERLKAGERQRDVAKDYGVCQARVSQLVIEFQKQRNAALQ